MKVWKLNLESPRIYARGVAVVAADTEDEARAGFNDVGECELLSGLTFDPALAGPPIVFNEDGTPMQNVLVYEWFET